MAQQQSQRQETHSSKVTMRGKSIAQAVCGDSLAEGGVFLSQTGALSDLLQVAVSDLDRERKDARVLGFLAAQSEQSRLGFGIDQNVAV